MDESQYPFNSVDSEDARLLLRRQRGGREVAVAGELPPHHPARAVVRRGGARSRRSGRGAAALRAPPVGRGARRRATGWARSRARSPTSRDTGPTSSPTARPTATSTARAARAARSRRSPWAGPAGAGCSSSPRPTTNVGERALTIGDVDYSLSGESGIARRAPPLRVQPLPQALPLPLLRRPRHGGHRRRAERQTGLLPPVHQPRRQPGDEPAAPAVRRLRLPGRRRRVGGPVPGRAAEPVARHDRHRPGHLPAHVRLEPGGPAVRGHLPRPRRQPARARGSGDWARTDLETADGRAGGGAPLPSERDVGRQQPPGRRAGGRAPRPRPDHRRVRARPAGAAAQLRLRPRPGHGKNSCSVGIDPA